MFRRFLLLSLVLYSNLLFPQSPYKLSWKKDAPLAASGIAIGGVSTYFLFNTSSANAEEISGLSASSVNSFDRSATCFYAPQLAKVSDIAVVATIALPAVLFADRSVRTDFFTITAMYAETMLYAYALPSICKGTVLRYRPLMYNQDVSIDDKLELGKGGKWSFFSGHTTAAFASAFFIAKVYSDYHPKSKFTKYIYGGTIITASAIGFMRYRSGKHFPTDIITGAAVGALLGYGIPALHKVRNSKLTFVPGISPYGMSMTMNF